MEQLKINSKTLSEVISKCKKADTLAQEVLFRFFAPKILTTCRRYELPDFGAEDILHETFIIVFKKIKQFDESKGTIEVWIRRIAINVALKFMRDKKIQITESEDYLLNFTEVEDISDITQLSVRAILDIIKILPLGYRTVFNMYLIEGYTHEEIANYLGISTSTSMSQLSKAKKMVKNILQSKNGKIRSIKM